jgi:hypothetical protein
MNLYRSPKTLQRPRRTMAAIGFVLASSVMEHSALR